MNSTSVITSQVSDPLFQPPISAPKATEGVLVFPTITEFVSSSQEHRERSCERSCRGQSDGQGRVSRLVSQRDFFRNEVLELALSWTSQYTDLEFSVGPENKEIYFAGHQPEFFHPGVWFKNFVLNRVAKRRDAVAVNLVVDNDLAKSNAIYLPHIGKTGLEKELAFFDMGGVGVAFEEKKWNFPAVLEKFLTQVESSLSSIESSLFKKSFCLSFADRLKSRLGATECFPHALAQARHLLEIEFGVENLELPISLLCHSNAFASFFKEVAFEGGKFFEIHNSVLGRYRTVNGLKSKGRPVPELEEVVGKVGEEVAVWKELPFWVWTSKNTSRSRLFGAMVNGNLWLTDRPKAPGKAVFLESCNRENFSQQWREWQSNGVKIRTRALTTTLFSRLLLCDGFVHGLGGAIYDRITDQIAIEFFGLRLSPYLTATMTRWLPLQDSEQHSGDAGETGNLDQLVLKSRQYLFQAEKQSGEPVSEGFVRAKVRKEELLKRIPRRGEKASWQLEMEEVNRVLASEFQLERQRVLDAIQQIKRNQSQQKIMKNREWSFLLYSRDLIEQMKAIASKLT